MSGTVNLQSRVYNFSAGPAVLPVSVLEKIQQDLLCLPGAGASILEISHRCADFIAILESAKSGIRQLLAIPEDYKILFLQGGSRLQFSMIPMNLLRNSGKTADYILTGSWGKKAFAEAKKEGNVNVAWDGKENSYSNLPTQSELRLTADAAYCYITSNETIEGVQFHAEPDTGNVPLISDASSDFMHRPLPIEKYGMVYACAQKNAGPAGVTVVIAKEELLTQGADDLPGYLNYKQHLDNDSMYNTPPTFAIYVLDLVAKWLLNDIGGLDKMHQLNQDKAALLYDVVDGSNGFYAGHAAKNCRSLMNVTFRLPNDELQSKFVKQAAERQLTSLKGHRSVGGIRVSIYNAMPLDGVVAMRDFMQEFAQQNA